MCGIASYFGPGPFDSAAFLRELAHRGPDARGTWSAPAGTGNQVSLVHTRLSILDLSPAGNQPMLLHPLPGGGWRTEAGGGVGIVASRMAGYAVAYNGEIYNFAELRAELLARGHTFSSSGDTEVLLRGYAEWGRGVFAKLDGIFAAVIYDGPGRRLVVARDHLGIKPLYFGRARDGGFLFASQVRAIVASGQWDGRINRTAILDYLRFGSFQEPATAFSGICAFEPGCVGWVEFEDGVPGIIRTERYWAIERMATDNAKRDWRAEHADYLKRAVADQLISDVPVGVFLSGGLDSTLILELAATMARDRLTAFTVGGELTTNDEAGIAARTAANLGVKHLLVRPTRGEQEQWIKQALLSMDQPSCDGVNTYVVSRASRAAGLVVAIGGTGADELHGAYGHASTLPRLMRLMENYSSLSRPFGQLAAKMIEFKFDTVAGERLQLMLEQVRSPWRLLQEKRRFFTTKQIEELWPEGGSIPVRWQAPAADEAQLALLSDESQITIAETRGYLLNTLLRDSDWATMANQQELRVPFLGRRYVEFMLSMPAALKAPQGSIKKPLLAEMILPANRALIDFPKRGFSMNYAELLLGPLREEFHADCEWLNEGLSFRINAKAQLDELRSSSSPKVANRLWALFALGSYYSRYGQ
jgi:asparagine synthase (glutamine-hydrolysing)